MASTSRAFAGVDPTMRRTIDQRGEVAEELTRRASWKAAQELIAHEMERCEVEAKASEMRDELQRNASRRAAAQMYAEEKQRQVFMLLASQVLGELERRANAAAADRAMLDEQARRVDAEAALQLAEDAERLANQSQADQDTEMEKKRREDAGIPTQEAAFARLSWFANEVVRAINKNVALQGADAERQRRVFNDLRVQVANDLERNLNARTADAASEQERLRRVMCDRKLEILAEIESAADRKLASELARLEQQRRVAADADFPFGRTSETRTSILRKVHSRHSLREALKAEQIARDEYALADIYSRVAQEVCFRVNKAAALAAEDAERVERVAQAVFDDYVVPSLAERGRFQDILEQVRAAQADLVAAMPEELRRRALDANTGALIEALARAGNQKLASALADEERTRRTAETAKLDVLGDLQRAVARREISAEVETEAARAAHQRSFELAREQAAAEARRKQLWGVIEAGRGAPEPRARSDAFAETLVEVERAGARRSVADAVKEEQVRRTQLARGEDVFAGVVRAVNQREAARACDLEQQQRIARAKGEAVVSALERRTQQNLVKAQTEAEREQRIVDMSDDLRRRSGAPYLQPVLDELTRHRKRREALRLMDDEQQFRVARDRLSEVVVDLQRHLNRLWAASEAEMERCRRVELTKTRMVLNELERYHNRVLADAQVQDEQERRVRDMDIERNRRGSVANFYEFLEQIERRHAQQVADREAELERDARVTRETFTNILDQLVRSARQKSAGLAMDAERVLRIAQEAFGAVNQEFLRRVSAMEADRAADQERLDRIQRLARDPTFLLDLLASPMPRVREELCRKASWKTSKAAYECEQAEAETVNRGTAVREQLERCAAIKAVEAAIEVERQRLIHASRQEAVLAEMLGAQRAQQVILAEEKEREERVANAATTAMKFAQRAAKFQGEIPVAAAAHAAQRRAQAGAARASQASAAIPATVDELRGAEVSFLESQRQFILQNLDEAEGQDRLSRVASSHLASLLSDEEKARRVAEVVRENAAEELERRRAQLKAALQIDTERLVRVQALQLADEDAADERRANRAWASFVSDEERKRRILEESLGVAKRRPRPAHLVALLSADCERFDFMLVDGDDAADQDGEWAELSNNLCVSPRLVRLEGDITTNLRSALDFYREQQRRRIEDKEAEIAASLERARNQRRARFEQDLELFRRTQENKLYQVLDRLERAHAVREACLMADLERERRVQERAHVEMISAETKRISQEKAIQDMEIERQRRMKESAQFREAMQMAAAASSEVHF